MPFNIHLRGVDDRLMNHLKQEATKNNISMNSAILSVLQRNFGLTNEQRSRTYHDLDKFAGTWSKQDAKTFLKTIADFEQIDKDLWK